MRCDIIYSRLSEHPPLTCTQWPRIPFINQSVRQCSNRSSQGSATCWTGANYAQNGFKWAAHTCPGLGTSQKEIDKREKKGGRRWQPTTANYTHGLCIACLSCFALLFFKPDSGMQTLWLDRWWGCWLLSWSRWKYFDNSYRTECLEILCKHGCSRAQSLLILLVCHEMRTFHFWPNTNSSLSGCYSMLPCQTTIANMVNKEYTRL